MTSWSSTKSGRGGPTRRSGLRSRGPRELGRKRHAPCNFPFRMPLASAPASTLDAQSRDFYRNALGRLDDAGLPYLVGGAYALARYTGIERHTKDFDIFIRRSDWKRAQKILQDAGFETDLTYPHWLGKAWSGDDFIDLIF